MATPIYRFGAFRLDPLARELYENERRVALRLSTIDCLIHLVRHRDRPVGRDELASAVWGRIDVSEVSLTHAIMSLRRTLGDTGNEQRIIRTVPRLGYRWVLDDTVEEVAETRSIATPALIETVAAEPGHATPIVVPPRPRRLPWLVLAITALVIAGLAAWLYRGNSLPPDAARAAMVLPAAVEAPPDAAWLRLGLMDLVAQHLRRGDVPTAPSETVVALVDAHGDAAPDAVGASLVVRPSASLQGGTWRVLLRARTGSRELVVETHHADAVAAGRQAADELLIKLGRKPPADAPGDDPIALETLRQRVSAAVLAGRTDVARQLVDEAPAALQSHPQIALARAQIAFFEGRYDQSRHELETLVARVPAAEWPALRARALNALGAAYFRLGRVDDAGAVYAEAAQVVANTREPQTLAKAHAGLGAVASQKLALETAAAQYGRARTLFEVANDPQGVASIDLNLAMNAMQRGQPAAALPMLGDVAARFERLGFHDALATTLVTTVDAQLSILDAEAALATSGRFAALPAPANARQRGEMDLARARALASSGRLDDAEALAAQVLDTSSPNEEPLLRARANALSAELALARGDAVNALTLAETAMIEPLERYQRPDYLAAWITRLHALQHAGRLDDAAAELARLRAWRDAGRQDADQVPVALAEAEQAAASGRLDDALPYYAAAMEVATRRGVPEELVAVGASYVPRLVAAGRIDEAVSVGGRLAPWAGRDARAAWVEASVLVALQKPDAAQAALARARRLAGDRSLPDLPAVTANAAR